MNPLSYSVPRRWTALAAGMTLAATTAAVAVPSPALAASCPLVAESLDEVIGDWDGDGTDSIGLFDSRTATWDLRNADFPDDEHLCFRYGTRGDRPVVGDWDGNGTDTVGVVRAPVAGDVHVWHLRNSNTGGPGQLSFSFGPRSSRSPLQLSTTPLTGDWDGDGDTTIGVVEYTRTHLRWHLRNFNSTGPDSLDFRYGVTRADLNDRPLVGDWDGDGTDTVGVSQPLDGTNDWHLRNSNTGGGSDVNHRFAQWEYEPITGDWNGNGIDSPGVVYRVQQDDPDPTVVVNRIRWTFRNDPLVRGIPGIQYGTERIPR